MPIDRRQPALAVRFVRLPIALGLVCLLALAGCGDTREDVAQSPDSSADSASAATAEASSQESTVTVEAQPSSTAAEPAPTVASPSAKPMMAKPADRASDGGAMTATPKPSASPAKAVVRRVPAARAPIETSPNGNEICLFAPLEEPSAFRGLTAGEPAPPLNLVDQTDESKAISLASLRGKWVVLKIWADWCPICRRSNETFARELHDKLGDRDLEMINVAIVQGRTTARGLRATATARGYDWTLAMDTTGDFRRAYGPAGQPTVVIIDPEGVVTTFSRIRSGDDWERAAKAFLTQQCIYAHDADS